MFSEAIALSVLLIATSHYSEDIWEDEVRLPIVTNPDPAPENLLNFYLSSITLHCGQYYSRSVHLASR